MMRVRAAVVVLVALGFLGVGTPVQADALGDGAASSVASRSVEAMLQNAGLLLSMGSATSVADALYQSSSEMGLVKPGTTPPGFGTRKWTVKGPKGYLQVVVPKRKFRVGLTIKPGTVAWKCTSIIDASLAGVLKSSPAVCKR